MPKLFIESENNDIVKEFNGPVTIERGVAVFGDTCTVELPNQFYMVMDETGNVEILSAQAK